LRFNWIEVDVARALPTQIQQHLDTVLLRARDGPRLPNAKRIVQQRLTASLDNESTGIRRLELLLLFAGEDDLNTIAGVPLISTKLNYNLSRNFLPVLMFPFFCARSGSQPRANPISLRTSRAPGMGLPSFATSTSSVVLHVLKKQVHKRSA
jgi:hypothetical protein